MNPDIREITKRMLHKEFESLSLGEQNVIRRFALRHHVSRNVHQEEERTSLHSASVLPTR